MKHVFSTPVLCGLALGALAACGALFGKGPHVPDAYAGTTQVTIANAGDAEICVFTMFSDGGSSEDNWLGDKTKAQVLKPKERHSYNIKPGTYHVNAGFCQDGQLIAAVGTYGSATKTIEGPTFIALGPLAVEPIAGAQRITFSKFYRAAGGGGDAGGGETATPSEEPASAEASSSSSSSSSSASSSSEAPSGPKCLAHGAVCNDAEHCCSGMSCASRTKFSDGSLGNGYCQ